MSDKEKQKDQLVLELQELRKRLADAESAATGHPAIKDASSRLKGLTSLHSLGRAISSGLSADQIVADALREVMTIVAPDLSLFYFLRDGKLTIKSLLPDSPQFNHLGPEVTQAGECLCGLAAEGKPVYSRDMHADPWCIHDDCRKTGIRSFAALPLIGHDGVLGTLCLGSLTERDFSEQSAFLEAIAGLVAGSLQNALAYDRMHSQALELEEQAEALKTSEQALHRVNRALRTLSKCHAALIHAENETSLLNDICTIIVTDGGYRLAWVGYAEHDEAKRVRPVAQAGFEEGYLETVNITWADTERGQGPTGTAVRTGHPVVIKDIMTDSRYVPWREQASRHGYASGIALPLQGGPKPLGALNIYSAEPYTFDDDEVKLLTELAADLTYGILALRMREDHKRAEEALRRSEMHLEEAQRMAHIGSWEWDAETGIPVWSKELCTLLDVDPTKPAPTMEEQEKIYTPESMKKMYAAVEAAMRTGAPFKIELERVRKDGTSRWLWARGEVELDENRNVIGLRGTALDITDRKRAEVALHERDELLQQVIRVSQIGIFDHNQLTDTIYCSPQQRVIHGWGPDEPITLQAFLKLIHPEDLELIAASVRRAHDPTGDGIWDVEHRIIRRDGVVRWLKERSQTFFEGDGDACRPIRTIGAVLDITDRKLAEEEREKLQAQLLHIQKLESIGQLAGGIAHDFNNILAAIMGYANLFRMKMRKDDPHLSYLDEILASSDRAAQLTRSLLAFSRQQTINPKPTNVNDLVKRVETFLARIIGEDIDLQTVMTECDLIVQADAAQIEQVLMNLATNARDAMPKGGQFVIETKQVEFDDDYVRAHGFGEPGIYAMISATDSGAGMDEKTREKIFDPFFTTKEVGKGTGLGLSIVYGIVKQHNGYVNVYSEPGKGTTFRIYLPLIQSEALQVKEEEKEPAARGGTETILLTEDDPRVLKITSEILKEFGYTVIEATDGQDAVEKFREFKNKVDLLVLDVIMPRKNGREAYEEALKIKPGIKALFTSGYPSDIIRKQGVLEQGLNFIPKPSAPRDFLRKVREVLDA